MAKEIELKAHVYDFSLTLEKLRLNKHISNETFAHKLDVYYFNPLINQSFRVRQELLKSNDTLISKETILTVKQKSITEGIEQNNEIEVELPYDNFKDTLTFFDSMGFNKTIRKSKTGYSFNFNKFEYPLHIELLEVNDLGWFFEIEFVIDESIDQNIINTLINNLYETLKIFDIPIENIEKRYYSQMITQ